VVTVSDATLAAHLKADGVGAAPAYITVGASSLMGFPRISAGVGGLGAGVGARLAAARQANAAREGNYVNLANPERTAHILEGEPKPDGSWSGGHAWPGAPGKTPFPRGWSDARIMHEVSDVATDPKLQWVQQSGAKGAMFTRRGLPAVYTVTGERGGIPIKVVLEPAGRGIVTAHPVPRGP
jgi:hypothetical protein